MQVGCDGMWCVVFYFVLGMNRVCLAWDRYLSAAVYSIYVLLGTWSVQVVGPLARWCVGPFSGSVRSAGRRVLGR